MHIASGLSLALSRKPLLSDLRGPRRIRQTARHVAAGLEERGDRRTVGIKGEALRSAVRAARRRGRRRMRRWCHRQRAPATSACPGLRPALPAAARLPPAPPVAGAAFASGRAAAFALPPAASVAARRSAVGALPHAGEVGLAVRRARRRGGPAHVALRVPRHAGIRMLRPLRATEMEQAAITHTTPEMMLCSFNFHLVVNQGSDWPYANTTALAAR